MACGCNIRHDDDAEKHVCCEDGVQKIVYPLQYEDSLVVQRVLYEKDGLLALCTQFTSTSPFKPDQERYDQILDKYIKSFAEYNLVFQVLMEKYVSKEDAELISGKMYELKVDFLTNSLIVEYQ